jgi:hypothetical protein
VQDRRLEDCNVVAAADRRDQRGDLDRVIDVRYLAISLAPLLGMLASGEGNRLQ